jgi:alcohol dehydrogenase
MFRTTRNLLFELNSSKKVGELLRQSIPQTGKKGVMLVTDKGILNSKLEVSCLESLYQNGFDVEIYSDVIADPPERNIYEAVEICKVKDIGAVIGLGGGSSMDVAKLVSYLSHKNCHQSLRDIYGVEQCTGDRLPLIQIPTTAGTGSEVTPISIVTTGDNEKKGVVSSKLLPDWAVLDGNLTLTVPPLISAATGIDAMVHAIEAYTSKIKKNSLSDMFAIQALKLLGSNIRIVCSDGSNSVARGNMLLGSMYAGMAFANSPVGAVHVLAYPIGSHFHVSHGLSNSLMLP